jgi:hypothetical protein
MLGLIIADADVDIGTDVLVLLLLHVLVRSVSTGIE